MSDHDETSNHGGLVDPSLLDPHANNLHEQVQRAAGAGGIPDFLKRAPASDGPVFDTQVNEEGQTELVIENGDAALDVLNALPDQAAGHTDLMVSPEAIDEATANLVSTDPVTTQGNEALVSNAPSEVEKAEIEKQVDDNEGTNEAPPQMGHNAPANPEEMRRDFFKDINKFGKASGEGASALGRLGIRALRAAADGVISTAKPQGGGKDDATLIYEAYTAMDSKHSEHTAGGAKANASKLRQIIGMGCMTTLSDPVAVGDRVVRIHEEMTDAELKPKALFAALVDVAREQQASDTELTDDAIKAALTKTKADKTLEKEWEAIAKRIEGLVTGENSANLKDQSEAAIKIQELVTEHIKNYKLDGTRQDRIEAMMECGYTREQATAIVDKKINV